MGEASCLFADDTEHRFGGVHCIKKAIVRQRIGGVAQTTSVLLAASLNSLES